MNTPPLLLIVDDEPMILNLLRLMLAERFSLRMEDRGHEALRVAQTEPIDLAIIDKKLPDIDGVALIRHLRQAGLTIPLVLLTGELSVREQIAAWRAAGMTELLAKPFTMQTVLASILPHLDMPQEGGQ